MAVVDNPVVDAREKTPPDVRYQWAIVILVWTLVGIFSASQLYLEQIARERPLSWPVALRLRLPPYYLWAAFTPFIFYLGNRFSLTGAHRLIHTAIHVIVGAGIVLVYLLLNSLTIALTEFIPLTPAWLLRNYVKHLVGSLHVYYLMYWAILAAGYAFAAHRQSRQASDDAHSTSGQSTDQASEQYLQRLEIRESGHIRYVPVEEIEWIQAADHYVEVRSAERTHLLRESLSRLESSLEPSHFVRIHRSTIVNIAYIRELQPATRDEYVAILHDGSRLKVSRSRRERLKAILPFSA